MSEPAVILAVRRTAELALSAAWRRLWCCAASTGDHLKRRPDMTTEGIEAVFLETRNWGKAAKCAQGA